METKIEVKEQDLFKITTIKKKHAEQIRAAYRQMHELRQLFLD